MVIPAYNEELLIGRVIETMPDFVDWMIVVNDNSSDETAEVVEGYKESCRERLVLINLEHNLGVGGAICEGYKWAREHSIDLTAVMAGDAQMSPDDLPALLDPIVDDRCDYSKGNRLFSGEAWKMIPRVRYLGNSILSLLSKVASGYWHLADSQTGYTVASLRVLATIDLDGVYKRYGMPNDMLVKLNVFDFRVRDVYVKPVYNQGEKSGIRIWRVFFSIPVLLFHPCSTGTAVSVPDVSKVRDQGFSPADPFLLLRLLVAPRRCSAGCSSLLVVVPRRSCATHHGPGHPLLYRAGFPGASFCYAL